MNGQSRRQWALLGLLAISGLGYLRYAPGAGLGGGDVGDLPAIDLAGLDQKLQEVTTVSPDLVSPPRADSHPDRNLFQYGAPKPPPVDPAEVERRRVAAEQALMRQEEDARRVKEQQERNAQIAQQQAALAQALPPPPPPPPPAENRPPPRQPPKMDHLRLVGMLGSPKRKIGVFVSGQSTVLAKRGEVLEEKFKILEIGATWADVGYVDPAFEGQKRRIEIGS